jgi:hypothetical protein
MIENLTSVHYACGVTMGTFLEETRSKHKIVVNFDSEMKCALKFDEPMTSKLEEHIGSSMKCASC